MKWFYDRVQRMNCKNLVEFSFDEFCSISTAYSQAVRVQTTSFTTEWWLTNSDLVLFDATERNGKS